jgi:hypothetical protein
MVGNKIQISLQIYAKFQLNCLYFFRAFINKENHIHSKFRKYDFMSLNIIPSDLSNLTKGESKVANKIISLYSQVDRDCYLYIKPRLRNLEPDFILIDIYKGTCIIEVKDWSKNYIKSINRVNISTTDNKSLENPVFKTNKYFNLAKSLFESENRLLNAEGNLKFNTYSKVIFTNINHREIESLSNFFDQPPTKYLTSDQIGILTIDKLFNFDTCYLESIHTAIIRSILFPEIKIENTEKDEIRVPGIEIDKIKVLDVEQEKFAKRIPYGHYMISGVPGSGKTIIMISRAIFLLKENPNWKIKIVTYNRLLSKKITQRLESLYDELGFLGLNYENIFVSTFHRLALKTANITVPNNSNDDFWNRILPLKALEKASPKYDAILIDEYQDFYDDWIRLCLALCKKHEYDTKISENLFLAGDRLQSIYNPKEHTWKSLGVNIQGRSKILKHSYRSGKSHIELGLDFLMADKTLKKEVERFYEGREGIDNETDLEDHIEFLEGGYKVINDFLNRCIFKFGYKKEDILVLAPYHEDAEELYYHLDAGLKSQSKVTKDIVDNKIIITTFHSSKGLESKICVLVNVDKIDNKKLLYVGITRASERLCIHATDYERKSFAKQLKNREFEDKNLINIINRTLSDYLSS